MTFKIWLMAQKKREDPVGDFARNVLQDRTWPPTQDMVKLRQHMTKLGSKKDALAALDQAYSEYQKQGNKQRPSAVG